MAGGVGANLYQRGMKPVPPLGPPAGQGAMNALGVANQAGRAVSGGMVAPATSASLDAGNLVTG
jgi:hypothetical protein